MKANQFIQELNRLVKPFEGKRVSVGEFHGDIRGAVNHAVEDAGLEFSIWHIDKDFDQIIKYMIEIEEDKRYKNKRIGKLTKVEFFPCVPVDGEDTIDDLVRKAKIQRLEKTLTEQEQDLQELLTDVEEKKQFINGLKNEVQQLKEAR